MNNYKLGVDIGGVIIAEIKAEGGLAHIDENYLKVPIVSGSIDALRILKSHFGDDIYLISKARAEVEPQCRDWLRHHLFFEETEINPQNLHFCRERSGKKDLCLSLGITHFIDDKLEVLSHLVGTVPNLYLFHPHQEENVGYEICLTDVVVIQDWVEALALLGR